MSEFEYKLLKLLATSPNQIVSRTLIERELWTEDPGSEQSLNNFISKLRKHLSEDEQIKLESIQKQGYRLSY